MHKNWKPISEDVVALGDWRATLDGPTQGSSLTPLHSLTAITPSLLPRVWVAQKAEEIFQIVHDEEAQ